jgi:hypothetical protein
MIFAGTSSEEHLHNDLRAFKPREKRELLSLGASLGTVVKPVEARVYLFKEQPSVKSSQTPLIRAPITVSDESTSLVLDHASPLPAAGAVDLLLARVEIDSTGKAIRAETLNSIDPTVKTWFDRFGLTRGRFFPATNGLTSTTASALILVRVVTNPTKAEAGSLLPRESSWLREYAIRIGKSDLPPVTEVSFVPAAEVIPLGPQSDQRDRVDRFDANRIELHFGGSSWCPDSVRWVLDGTAPGGIRQEWVAAAATAGSKR